MFDYYAYKKDIEELARKNEEVRAQLRAQREREETERFIEEEKRFEVRNYRLMNCLRLYM